MPFCNTDFIDKRHIFKGVGAFEDLGRCNFQFRNLRFFMVYLIVLVRDKKKKYRLFLISGQIFTIV